MIELYTWKTPNGRKATIMLEETGLPYNLHPIDISKGDQFTPEYIAINPNSKIPALVDADGPGGKPIAVFESGALLIYLGEKSGKFYPRDARKRYDVLQWLMFQMAGVGPMIGQNHHFRRVAPEKIPYGIERYGKETERLYGVMDKHLAQHEFFAAGEYTIADMAIYPWIARHELHEIDLATFPQVQRWFDALSKRPALLRGMELPA